MSRDILSQNHEYGHFILIPFSIMKTVVTINKITILSMVVTNEYINTVKKSSMMSFKIDTAVARSRAGARAQKKGILVAF